MREEEPSVDKLLELLTQLQTVVTQLSEENQQLRGLLHVDPATQLHNRLGFEHELERALHRSARYGGGVSVVLVDLDRGTSGATDASLRRVAEVVRASVRVCDVPARLQGNGFGVLLPSTAIAGAGVVGERIRSRVAIATLSGGGHVTASVGVASGSGALVPGDLLHRAEAALHVARRSGGNRVVVDTDELVAAAGTGLAVGTDVGRRSAATSSEGGSRDAA